MASKCPYCDAEASPVASIQPFCSSLHRTANTRGRARALENIRLKSCAAAGERAALGDLVHVVASVSTISKNNKHHYLEYTSSWYTLCGSAFDNAYPPKTEHAITCMSCLCKL